MKKIYLAACILLLITDISDSAAQAVRRVQFTLNAAPQYQLPISPFVYGTNDMYEYAGSKRLGGNRLTGYNWENNASNSGRDFGDHDNDDYVPWWQGVAPNQYEEPGSSIATFHNRSLQQGAYSLVTLPMAGYVARDKNGSVPASQAATTPRWAERWAQVRTRKPGGNLSLTPNLTDNFVYLDEEMNFIINRFSRSNTPTGIKGYALDNEPCLWFDSHSRLFGHTGVSVNYLMNKSYETAEMVKDMDPSAEVFGPALWGYTAYQNLQFAPDWDQVRGNYSLFIHYYLANMRQRSQQQGRRLLDVLDLHWYPAENDRYGGMSPFDDLNDPNSVAGRMEMSRGLWDETYVEQSWVTDASNGGIFPAIPKLRAMIDQYYPGTKLAITEYSYGGTSHVSGVVAQADALGAFGIKGLYLATYWGGVTGYIRSGFDLYRNYDGNGGQYGNTAISAETDNRTLSAVYASIQAGNDARLHTIAINRNLTDTVISTYTVTGTRQYRSAEVYVVDRTSTAVRRMEDIRMINNNSFELKLPPATVFHLVLRETDLSAHPFITDAQITPAAGYTDGTASFTISATITDSDNNMNPPTVDLRPVGGSPNAVMTRNGNHYTLTYTVPAGTATGSKQLILLAEDAGNNRATALLQYRLIRDLPGEKIWDGDAVRGGVGETFYDGEDQRAAAELVIERRAAEGNEEPGSMYMHFSHSTDRWNMTTWRLDADPGKARNISDYGYLEFYIRSNAPANADIEISMRDASEAMNVTNVVRLKGAGYITSFSATQYSRVRIPLSVFTSGTAFDLSLLWQFNFLTNTASEGFDLWIDDIRAIPFENPAVQPVLQNLTIQPPAGFADGTTPVTISVTATDPNNDLRTVTVDLSSINGSNKHPLALVNGRHAATFTIPVSAIPGVKNFTVTATDNLAHTADATVTYTVWGRASSDVIWDGDTRNPGRLLDVSNSTSRLTIGNTAGNEAPMSMDIHLQPGSEPWAAVTWDLFNGVESQLIDLRQKRYIDFSIKVDHPLPHTQFNLAVYLKDRFAESSNVAYLREDGYLSSFDGTYQHVRIPLEKLFNNAPIQPGHVAWIGFLSERMPAAGVDFHIDDIKAGGSIAADVTIATHPASCGANGRIEVTRIIGTTSGNFRYFLDGVLNAAGQVFSAVSPGLHEIRIEGSDNFVYVEMVQVTGNAGNLIITGTVDHMNGSVDVTVTGGSGNYTYLWSNQATTQDVTGLASGTYSVTVTDVAQSCNGLYTVTITRPAVNLDITVTPAACAANGSIRINAITGTNSGNYRYSLNGQANPAGAANPVFSNLAPGVYNLTISGDNQFIHNTSITVGGFLNNLLVTATADESGNVASLVTGGSGNYRYLWSNNETTRNLIRALPGDYTVTVIDQVSGCSAAFTIKVERLLTPLKIYPNPAKEGFRVEYMLKHNSSIFATELSIKDLFGRRLYRQILTGDEGNIYIAAGILRPGIYYVEIRRGNEKYVKEVLIIK